MNIKVIASVIASCLASAACAVELENGAEFKFSNLPTELTAQVPRGSSVRFILEENASTGYHWEAVYSHDECEVAFDHRPPASSTSANGAPTMMCCGASGRLVVQVAKKPEVQAPSLVELRYIRPWEKDEKPAHVVRLVVYTIDGKAVDWTSRTPKVIRQ